MSFLIFADLHSWEKEKIDLIKEDFDAIIFLGDINVVALKYIMSYFHDKPAFGVLGNHDEKNTFETTNMYLKVEKEILCEDFVYPIENLFLNKKILDGISFVGFEGCVKYKNRAVEYTQEEAASFDIPAADILFSHETGYGYFPEKRGCTTHEGFEVISEYIKDKNPQYHIFGHHHQNVSFKKENTKCFCVYGCSLFDSEASKIKKVF